MISLTVNGRIHELDVDPETPLLWVLNEQLGLTGTKYSCGIGECGACTVFMDGEPALSCMTTAKDAQDRDITTIEGLTGTVADALRKAWEQEDVAQCGYCQPGQIMTAAALLTTNTNPDEDAIDDAMSGVLCRCGSYQAIRKAIHRSASEVRHGSK